MPGQALVQALHGRSLETTKVGGSQSTGPEDALGHGSWLDSPACKAGESVSNPLPDHFLHLMFCIYVKGGDKRAELGIGSSQFKSQPCLLLVMQPWASYSIHSSLCTRLCATCFWSSVCSSANGRNNAYLRGWFGGLREKYV